MSSKSEISNCPIRGFVSHICDKWSLLVIEALAKQGTLRFTDLSKAIPDISAKMLSIALRNLIDFEIVSREAFPEVPPRVEYSLTEKARTLYPILQCLFEWANDNMPKK